MIRKVLLCRGHMLLMILIAKKKICNVLGKRIAENESKII